ncbi:U3 snoRNA associated-domain-containing protein, partial [Aspergillus ambiguus]|uniref:uncharacterized protein n=1 Tax=Aspergillus ambiguus TaxID=176160 RepID=UPI003CCC8F62
HFRFDSEEPEMPVDIPAEVPEQQPEPAEEDSSDDDEAPEAVDNSAEMSRLRQEAKKQEEIKQREGQLKKEKRKRLDELRKAQAKAANKKKDTLADDLVSESTETLQGSITQDGRRAALPALLPAEILNAAPAVRPPTPPAEGMDFKQKKPNKLKFLEKTEKRPKDVHMGDVTIRVLEDDVSRKKVKTNLPPKASKSGMNSKHNWMNRARSTGQVNGLRRTTGGPSGFVRR